MRVFYTITYPSVSANGYESRETIYEIGKEVTTFDIVYTVEEIGIAGSICIDVDDRIGLGIDGGSIYMAANNGYTWVYYSVKYKVTGTAKITAQGQFLPMVKYDDNCLATPALKIFKYDYSWDGLDYQWGNEVVIAAPLPATNTFYEYDPWVEQEYVLHGAVQVPQKAVDDTETPLLLELSFAKNDRTTEMVHFEVPREEKIRV